MPVGGPHGVAPAPWRSREPATEAVSCAARVDAGHTAVPPIQEVPCRPSRGRLDGAGRWVHNLD